MDENCPKYKIIRQIGKGAFGKVFSALNTVTGQKVAIKRTSKRNNLVSREVVNLEILMSSPSIIDIYDVFYTKTPQGFRVQNVVCELMDCSLGCLLRQSRKIKDQNPSYRLLPNTIKLIAKQLVAGLLSLHDRGIAHRDLKPDNIFLTDLDKDLIVKIGDLGSAKHLSNEEISMPYVCSRWYRAPELIFGWSQYTVSVDIWSLGCILMELCTLHPLFGSKKKDNSVEYNSSNVYKFSESQQIISIIEILGSPSREAIRNLMSGIPEAVKLSGLERLGSLNVEPVSLHAVLGPYMTRSEASLIDLMEKMLQWNPGDRISLNEAINHPYFNDVD